MPIHIKAMLLGMSVAVAFGFAPSSTAAQTTGPAALAAKQQIKAQVLSAMADGKISQDERRSILLNAKEVCTAKEYVGLVETINRLSPPDRATPENLGYAPFTDKQLMAQFPTWDLSWIDKAPGVNAIGKLSLPKLSSSKETIPKHSYVVREIITKQTIVRETTPNGTVVKATTPKQTVVKTTVKTTKSDATSKVVILPPPPQRKNNKQADPSAVGKAQNKISKSDVPTPPMPPAEQAKTRYTNSDKAVQQKVAESPKKRSVTGDQATIQQPAQLLDRAEKTSIKHSYNDYSVPVLTTPAAAMLSDRMSGAVTASFEQPLEPDKSSQSIIRQ